MLVLLDVFVTWSCCALFLMISIFFTKKIPQLFQNIIDRFYLHVLTYCRYLIFRCNLNLFVVSFGLKYQLANYSGTRLVMSIPEPWTTVTM